MIEPLRSGLTLDELNLAADAWLAAQEAAEAAQAAAKHSVLMLYEGLEEAQRKALLIHKDRIDRDQDRLAQALLAEYGLNDG